jgi:hypothetical protein
MQHIFTRAGYIIQMQDILTKCRTFVAFRQVFLVVQFPRLDRPSNSLIPEPGFDNSYSLEVSAALSRQPSSCGSPLGRDEGCRW